MDRLNQVHRIEQGTQGGTDTAVVKTEADVCLRCGERLYRPDAVQLFEQIRAKLECHDTADLTPVGRSFQVN